MNARGLLDRPEMRWALAIFALALALRLITIAVVHPDPRDGRYDDSVWYDTSARHLADGDGYVFDPAVWVTAGGSRVYPDEDELTPTALWPPGYPVALGAIYFLTGDGVWAGRLFNAFCGAATAALVFAIARRLFGHGPGVAAGLLMAVLPGHVLFTPLILGETFFLFLMTATLAWVLFYVLGRREVSRHAALVSGVLCGATAMVRGEFLLFPLVLLPLLALHLGVRASLRPAAMLLVGMLLLFVPWTVRNWVQLGEPIAGTTGAGRVALQGHGPDSDGGPSLIIVGQLEAEFAGLPRDEIEVRSNSEGTRRAREWALDHPVDELRLIPRRMYALFRSDESAVTWTQSNKPWFSETNADRLIRTSSLFFYGMIALALIGWPLWWRTGDPARLLVFAPVPFIIVMFGVLFIGDPRYHFGMYAPLAVLASPALAAIWSMTAEQWREVSGGRSLGAVLRTFGTPEP
ncbi:MAG: glycosyltransferase family 39 protein [Dehalococcoidia bacterium]